MCVCVFVATDMNPGWCAVCLVPESRMELSGCRVKVAKAYVERRIQSYSQNLGTRKDKKDTREINAQWEKSGNDWLHLPCRQLQQFYVKTFLEQLNLLTYRCTGVTEIIKNCKCSREWRSLNWSPRYEMDYTPLFSSVLWFGWAVSKLQFIFTMLDTDFKLLLVPSNSKWGRQSPLPFALSLSDTVNNARKKKSTINFLQLSQIKHYISNESSAKLLHIFKQNTPLLLLVLFQ